VQSSTSFEGDQPRRCNKGPAHLHAYDSVPNEQCSPPIFYRFPSCGRGRACFSELNAVPMLERYPCACSAPQCRYEK
jgi:hypothetical protein